MTEEKNVIDNNTEVGVKEFSGSDILYENTFYTVKLGESIHNPEKFMCYQVWNKKYNVVETETTVLPIARQNADEFAKELSRMLEEEGEGEDKKILTLQ